MRCELASDRLTSHFVRSYWDVHRTVGAYSPSESLEGSTMSSHKITRKYRLDVGVSLLNEHGDIDEKAHAKRVQPIVARLKELDGIDSAYVEQWHLKVNYWNHVTTAAAVDEHVDFVHAWSLDEVTGIYPLRGDRTPTVSLDEDFAQNWYECVRCTFSTHLTAFVPTGLSFDRQEFVHRTQGLARNLANIDGVVDLDLGLEYAVMKYDTRKNNQEDVRGHMERALRGAPQSSLQIFPFLAGSGKKLDLDFTFYAA